MDLSPHSFFAKFLSFLLPRKLGTATARRMQAQVVLLSCQWGVLTQISDYFQLYKINVDFTSEELPDIKPCDIIYFDAFGPDKQPVMWTPKIFNKIYDLTSAEAIFVTYSASSWF